MNDFSTSKTASRAELKDRAKGTLTGHYGNAILIFFLMALVSGMGITLLRYLVYYLCALFLMIGKLAGNAASLESVLSSAATLSELLTPYETALNILDWVVIAIAECFTGVLKTGVCLFCLNLCCGRRARISDLFYGYQYQFGKSLWLSLSNVLIAQLYIIPLNLMVSVCDGINAQLFFYLGLTVIGFILYVYLSLYLAMSWYLLLDFPSCSAAELLRLSARVIRGRKGQLLALYVSFLPLRLLGLCSFGIGNLWINPYIRVTYTAFFLDIMRQGYAENTK